MFSWLTQTIAVTALSVRTIPQRLGSSVVAIVGIAGVVIVFVAVLSIGEGFRAAMTGAGSPDRAIVMRSGADSEMTSGLGGAEADIIKQAPGHAPRRQPAGGVGGAVRASSTSTNGRPARPRTCRCAASSRRRCRSATR